MIISAKVVKQPRWARRCANCNRDILGPQLKLYGAAHYGEKPHNLYLHLECATDPDEKVQAALQSAQQGGQAELLSCTRCGENEAYEGGLCWDCLDG